MGKIKKEDRNMIKFGVVQIKGDEIRTLCTCGSREEALAAKQGFREAPGGIYVISGDFDENDRLTKRSFRLYD